MYPMPYALFLASCSMGSPMFSLLFLNSAFTYYFQSLRIPPGSQCVSVFQSLSPCLQRFSPFYLGYSPTELWDNFSGYMHPGIACLAFRASDWPGAFWASLSGFHSVVTPVKLILIGHCCDCLVGELNCLASTCWLIMQARMCSSTIPGRYNF